MGCRDAVTSPLTCLRVLTLSWMGLGKPTRVSVSLQHTTVATNEARDGGSAVLLVPVKNLLSQSEPDKLVPTGLQEVLNVFFPVDKQAAVR